MGRCSNRNEGQRFATLSAMDESKYRPHIGGDREYLASVADKIQPKTEFEEVHFEYLTELLQSLDLMEDPYAFVTLEGTDQKHIDPIVEKAFERINSGTLNLDILNKLHRLWDYLAESDPIEKSDLIFVFGGKGLGRVNEAVLLFNGGYASKIMFAGGHARYLADSGISEAEYYAEEAKRLGMREVDLLLETQSINTIENVVNSKEIFEKMSWWPQRVILITSATHMRRAHLTFKAVADWESKLIRHAIIPDTFSRENYFTDRHRWAYAVFEYLKLFGGRNMRHF